MSETPRRIAAFSILLLSAFGSIVTGGLPASKGATDTENNYASLIYASSKAGLDSIAQAANPPQPFDNLSLATPRRNHTATTLADGKLIFIGGDNQNGMVGESELLNPFTQTISVVATLINARTNHTATLLPDGKVLVVGGSNQKGALRSRQLAVQKP